MWDSFRDAFEDARYVKFHIHTYSILVWYGGATVLIYDARLVNYTMFTMGNFNERDSYQCKLEKAQDSMQEWCDERPGF